MPITDKNDKTETKLKLSVTETEGNADLLSKMWAKKKNTEIDTNMLDINPRHTDIVKDKVIDISKKYGIICRYTSNITVNEREDKQDSFPKAVAVPVAQPKEMGGKNV